MTAFTARRRAEEFDSLVEGTSTGRDDARYADFLDIVAQLRSAPEPVARPEFVGDLRERLMLAAATELAPADDDARLTLPARRPARERRIAIGVGALALVGATTSVAMAAQSALPGEALYPVKRAIENAQTGFSTDEADKGSRLLANASGRLEEVTELSEKGDLADNVAIASTLNTFTEQTTAASDLLLADYDATGNEASIDELRTFTADSMTRLTKLEETVPVEARDELIHAARVLAQIDVAAQRVCPVCAGGIADLPAVFFSGGTIGQSGDGAGSSPQQPQSSGDQSGKGDGKQDDPVLPETGGSLPPGSVLSPPSSDGGSTGGGGSMPTQPSNPLGELTEGLLGVGGSQDTSNNNQQQPLLPLPPVLEDTVDGLTDPLLGGGN